MDYDLSRSVRILEDSISARTRNVSFTGISKNTDPQRSKTFESPLLRTPRSIVHDEDKTINTTYDTAFNSFMENDDTIAGSILRVKQPWKSTANNLYLEFYETLQSHTNGQSVFEVIADLARCCSDTLQVIKGLKSKVSIDNMEEDIWLEDERNTWRLLYVLYQDRLSTQLMEEKEEDIYFGKSEKLCVLNLFKNNQLLRESQLVIDWLEYSAAERDIELLHFTDNSVGWENTLHQLMSAETIVFDSTRKIVSSLHPDARYVEKLPLHDLDMDDDKRLCRKMFQEIRCGKLEKAKDICLNCGHAWRAALLEGWRLYHNPNLLPNNYMDIEMEDTSAKGDFISEGDFQKDVQLIEGNATRDIWKNMAYKYCEQECLNIYERASLAAYCGNLSTLLIVGKSWEDYLWSYMKVLVDIKVESEIRDSIAKTYVTLPEQYWDQKMSLNEVFQDLETSENDTIRKEALMEIHKVQKYIILDDVSQLVRALSEWTDNPTLPAQFIRFAAHLVLFLERIGQTYDRQASNNILEAYISRLCEMNETQLIAFYTGKIIPNKQVLVYASYLERIVDEEERKIALSLAEDNGLNVAAVAKQVVKNIRNRPHEVGAFGDLQQHLTKADYFKVNSLDWLLIYRSHRLEAIKQTNALIFSFLTLKKVDAAILSFNKIPANSIDSVLSDGELHSETNQIIREFLSYKAYIDAHEAFNEWFKQFHLKPILPEAPPPNAPFTEKVTYQHRESQYKAETERWKLSTSHLAKKTKTTLYNVLFFPKGGWLVGIKDGEYLRSMCIPEIVLLLYSVLTESGNHEECIQLADILASEQYSLYKAFSKDKLGDVLMKLCESSVTLLNHKKDPWGNAMSN